MAECGGSGFANTKCKWLRYRMSRLTVPEKPKAVDAKQPVVVFEYRILGRVQLQSYVL